MLTDAEIMRLLAPFVGGPPGIRLVSALRRRLQAVPETLVALVRQLVAERPGDLVPRLERLAAGDGTVAASPEADAAYVFRRVGEYWEIRYGDGSALLRHGKGLSYLAALLARPGEPVHASSLVGRRRAGARGAELARLSVTKAIRSALARIGRVDPAFAEHLSATVQTGGSCAYRPDPRYPIRWAT